MRKDMRHLLLETGRSGGHGKEEARRRRRLKSADPDDLPLFMPSSRHRLGKELGDRLAPLRKFLAANCGRPWADVYREICEFADSRTIRGYHLRQHVWNFVVPSNYDVGHRRRYGPFFVDADGTLQKERPRVWLRRQQAWPWQKKENPRVAVDADHWYEKIGGYWYEFETKRWACSNSYEDLVEEGGEVRIVRIPLPDVHRHVTTKRQVNGRTQKALDRRLRAAA